MKFIEYVSSQQLWSFDHYPFELRVDSNGNETKIVCKTDLFYKYLTDFRNISRLTGVPFWAYILSCKIISYTCKQINLYRPMPTVEQMRFAAFNSLAYGAQGILYYRYGHKKRECDLKKCENGCVDDNIFPDIYPLDANGNKTEIWNSIKTVNAEIRQYQDVFLNCNVLDIFHVDQSSFNLNATPVKTAYSSESFVISYIRNGNYDYLVFLNKDYKNPADIYLVNNPAYNWNLNVKFLTPTSLLSAPLGASYSSQFRLQGAGYAILRWPITRTNG